MASPLDKKDFLHLGQTLFDLVPTWLEAQMRHLVQGDKQERVVGLIPYSYLSLLGKSQPAGFIVLKYTLLPAMCKLYCICHCSAKAQYTS